MKTKYTALFFALIITATSVSGKKPAAGSGVATKTKKGKNGAEYSQASYTNKAGKVQVYNKTFSDKVDASTNLTQALVYAKHTREMSTASRKNAFKKALSFKGTKAEKLALIQENLDVISKHGLEYSLTCEVYRDEHGTKAFNDVLLDQWQNKGAFKPSYVNQYNASLETDADALAFYELVLSNCTDGPYYEGKRRWLRAKVKRYQAKVNAEG